MLFGQNDGVATFLSLNSNKPVYLWNLRPHPGGSNSGISNMLAFDFLNNGNSELLLSRDDGSLELYEFDIDSELQLRFKE